MGIKAGRRKFTGTLKAAVLKALGRSRLTKKQLLTKVRAAPRAGATVTKLTASLRGLIADGKVVQVGKRARARFKRA